MTISQLIHAGGTIVESNAKSLTGPYLYSDIAFEGYRDKLIHTTKLNTLTQFPLIGNLAGLIRIALAIIHVIGHLFAHLIESNWGHFYHALKGLTEIPRGAIEAIPIIGTIFAWYTMETFGNLICIRPFSNIPNFTTFGMVKMYNPNDPDPIDLYENRWVDFRRRNPECYIVV